MLCTIYSRQPVVATCFNLTGHLPLPATSLDPLRQASANIIPTRLPRRGRCQVGHTHTVTPLSGREGRVEQSKQAARRPPRPNRVCSTHPVWPFPPQNPVRNAENHEPSFPRAPTAPASPPALYHHPHQHPATQARVTKQQSHTTDETRKTNVLDSLASSDVPRDDGGRRRGLLPAGPERSRAFYLRLSSPAAAPADLTLIYLPAIGGAAPGLNDRALPPTAPAEVRLRQVAGPAGDAAAYGSADRVATAEGARFEVYAGKERAARLEGIPEEATDVGWGCECGEEWEVVGDESDDGEAWKEEEEVEVETVRWAMEMGVWAVCLGVGLLATARRFRRKHAFW